MLIKKALRFLRRILSWVVTGAAVYALPRIVSWIYYTYFYLLGLLSEAFPTVAAVFSFLDDFISEVAETGICGLLVTGVVLGIFHLTVVLSERLHNSVLGGHFLGFSILSFGLIVKDGFSLWEYIRTWKFDGNALIQVYTLLAYLVFAGMMYNLYSAMGSLKLLLGNRRRVVLILYPKDINENFIARAYRTEQGEFDRRTGQINQQGIINFVDSAYAAGAMRQGQDYMIVRTSLIRPKIARIKKGAVQVYLEGASINYNPSTPMCAVFGLAGESGLFYIDLADARVL